MYHPEEDIEKEVETLPGLGINPSLALLAEEDIEKIGRNVARTWHNSFFNFYGGMAAVDVWLYRSRFNFILLFEALILVEIILGRPCFLG